MRVLRHYTDVPAEARGAVVAIGNFDGIHRGHRAVIGEAARIAVAADAPLAVLTFEPHPRSYFNPDAPAFRLTPMRGKAHQLEALGAEVLFVLHFDEALAAMPATDFVDQVIVRGIGARHLVVGYDFVFGHKRLGNTELLAQLSEHHGFALEVVAPVAQGDEICSSSRIRQALRDADPRLAAGLLGRRWEIEGRVGPGDKRGHQLGYPTANLALDDYLEPALGIYAVRAGLELDGELVWRDAVANLGRRPTFGGTDVILEVHLFDFAGDLYGQHMRVAFVDYIRPEEKFDDIEDLKAQMAADCDVARRLLGEANASEGAGEMPRRQAARQGAGS
jgi:riboflavin kinase/FMN adenylyltransferase